MMTALQNMYTFGGRKCICERMKEDGIKPSKKFLRKILGQDGQDLAQEAKTLPKKPRSCPGGQILPRILPKILGKILGKILAAIILASWTRSWASLGQEGASLGQVLGKSWARSLAQELFAGKSYLYINSNLLRVASTRDNTLQKD